MFLRGSTCNRKTHTYKDLTVKTRNYYLYSTELQKCLKKNSIPFEDILAIFQENVYSCFVSEIRPAAVQLLVQ